MTPTTNSTEQEEGWVEHDGSARPVDYAQMVEVRFADGDGEFYNAGILENLWRWKDRHVPDDSRIIAYRIVSQP